MHSLLQCDISTLLFKNWHFSSCLLTLVWPRNLLWPRERGGGGVGMELNRNVSWSFLHIVPLRPTYKKPVLTNWRIRESPAWTARPPGEAILDLPAQPSLRLTQVHEWARVSQAASTTASPQNRENEPAAATSGRSVLGWLMTPFLSVSTTGIIEWVVLHCGASPWAISSVQQHPWPLSTRCWKHPFPAVTIENASRHGQMFPGVKTHKWLRKPSDGIFFLQNLEQSIPSLGQHWKMFLAPGPTDASQVAWMKSAGILVTALWLSGEKMVSPILSRWGAAFFKECSDTSRY